MVTLKMRRERVKGLNMFHESYFEHSCTIQERKKDVLKMDIPGHFMKTKLKRWWYGLFLVSYSDERSRSYYTSSEAMRLDRTRHFRNYRGRIHPLSKFRNFWDLIMLILFIANKILNHHNTSVAHGQISHSFYYLGPVIEIIIIIDLYINFKTGYIDEELKRVILDKHEGVLHYCSTKLCFHVVSAIPLQCIMILRYGKGVFCELCKANRFVLTLRLIGVFGMFRIYELSSYWTREWSSFALTSFFRFFRVYVIGLLGIMYFQNICDKIVLMVMISEGKILESSYIGAMMYHKFVDPDQHEPYTLYLFSFVRATKTLVLLNFSNAKDYYLDKLVLILTNILVYSFYLWGVLEVYTFIHCIYFPESQQYKVNYEAFNLACNGRLPDKTTKKLWKYGDNNYAHLKAIEIRNNLYKTIPLTLKSDISLTAYNNYLKRIPYFFGWPSNVVQEICLMLVDDIYLNNELVAEPWEQSDGLTIVAVGELAVYNGADESGHLIDGDYFGELSLVTDKELRTSTVVAITSCVVLLLDKIRFRRFMRSYPELFLDMKEQLKQKFVESTQKRDAAH